MQRLAVLAEKGQPCGIVPAGSVGTGGVPAGTGDKLRLTGQPRDLPWPADATHAQPGTQRAVQTHLAPVITAAPQGHHCTADKAPGRLEERRCWVHTDLSDFAPRSQWSGPGAVAVLETCSENPGTGTIGTGRRCLITSLRPRAGESTAAFAAVHAGVVRAHGEIEPERSGNSRRQSSLHWRLDVLMGEDACQARRGEAAANLAVLRKIALNTLRLHPPLPGKKGPAMSLRSRPYVASISPNYPASLLKSPFLANPPPLPRLIRALTSPTGSCARIWKWSAASWHGSRTKPRRHCRTRRRRSDCGKPISRNWSSLPPRRKKWRRSRRS